MNSFSHGRRGALVALVVWALAGALPVAAQDPSLGLAKVAAMDWLVLADADDATKTYSTAAKRFRESMTADQWAGAMKQAREKFGKVSSRTNIAMRRPEGKEVPPGEYALLAFRTEYAKRGPGTETITLELEGDGKWRVVGYLMQ